MAHRPLPALFVLALALPLRAQELPQDPGVTTAYQAWRQQHGDAWILRLNPGTGTAKFLFGGGAEAPFAASTDAEYVELARVALHEAAGMFGLDDSTLVLQQVHRLPLSRIGGTDKIAVEFRQEVRGVPVVNGSASVLLAPGGRILALDTTGLPWIEQLSTRPGVDPRAAITAAHGAYAALEGRAAGVIGVPELVIYPHQPGKTIVPRLAWAVELRTPVADGIPSGRRMYVAADALADVLGSDQLVHTCGRAGTNDLTGHVDSFATPGVLPDTASNPETMQAMRTLRVTSSAGTTVTDAAGDFTIPHTGTSPVNLTFAYVGTWANVQNSAGSEYSLTVPFTPGVFQSVTMNPALSDQITAQANAFDGVQDFRAYLKAIDPGENTMDIQVLANVNISSTCNAYFDGGSINFYLAGGGCVNTAYSTVVAHEEGHWANVREGSGNGPDGFGEGNADVYAMYIYDTPIVGQGFYTSGGFIRSGNNTRQFCGDGAGGCYGEVHADGEVLMGALWKVRRNLNTTYGDAAGDLIADTLFVSWMNAYNDGQIRTVIEDHWLALDDDDANLGNGTPNFTDIDSAFQEQGFPGIPVLQIAHTPLPNTQNETGPYVVDADITSLFATTITSANLKYRVNGGGELTVPMSNTGGSTWSASIPGQQSVAFVDYHIEAADNQGNDARNPVSGEHHFIVGVITPIYTNGFEGATDEGWTHAQVATQDDWQRGAPVGKSDDPSAAFAGTKCWGNDIGVLSNYDGNYEANVNNHLDSPAINCTGKSGVRLQFMRWLNVEQGIYDDARIYARLNGVWSVVYNNPSVGDVHDSTWTAVDIDISAYADNNPALQIRFEMVTDGGLEFGGWNIDEFAVVSVEPVPSGTDSIVLTGSTSAVVGGTVSYSFSNAPANAPYWLYYAFNLNGSVINGQPFDIGTPRFTATTGTTSAAGTGAWTSGPIPSRGAGRTVYVEARADQGATTFDSNAVTLVIQ